MKKLHNPLPIALILFTVINSLIGAENPDARAIINPLKNIIIPFMQGEYTKSSDASYNAKYKNLIKITPEHLNADNAQMFIEATHFICQNLHKAGIHTAEFPKTKQPEGKNENFLRYLETANTFYLNSRNSDAEFNTCVQKFTAECIRIKQTYEVAKTILNSMERTPVKPTSPSPSAKTHAPAASQAGPATLPPTTAIKIPGLREGAELYPDIPPAKIAPASAAARTEQYYHSLTEEIFAQTKIEPKSILPQTTVALRTIPDGYIRKISDTIIAIQLPSHKQQDATTCGSFAFINSEKLCSAKTAEDLRKSIISPEIDAEIKDHFTVIVPTLPTRQEGSVLRQTSEPATGHEYQKYEKTGGMLSYDEMLALNDQHQTLQTSSGILRTIATPSKELGLQFDTRLPFKKLIQENPIVFIINTGDHWITIRAELMQDGVLGLLVVDSLSSRFSLEARETIFTQIGTLLL